MPRASRYSWIAPVKIARSSGHFYAQSRECCPERPHLALFLALCGRTRWDAGDKVTGEAPAGAALGCLELEAVASTYSWLRPAQSSGILRSVVRVAL